MHKQSVMCWHFGATDQPHMSGQNIMSCVLRVYDYRSSPNAECCMSGQSSKVKWPIPAPDGTFPLLDEGGVKKQVQT